jgi:hypothetical protein
MASNKYFYKYRIIIYFLNSRTSLPVGKFAQIARLALLNDCLKEKQIFMKTNIFFFSEMFLVAARSKAWVCGPSLTGILRSNPGRGVDV